MHILYLSLKPGCHSAERIREETEVRGHRFSIHRPAELQLDISSPDSSILVNGDRLERVDAVLARYGPMVGDYGMAVLRQFELEAVPVINSSRGIELARDKLRTCQTLQKLNLPIPRTLLVQSSEQFRKLAPRLRSDKYILKLPVGTKGIGVMLAESAAAAEAILDTFWGLQSTVLVQEFIPGPESADRRIYVIGGKVVAGISRRAAPGMFRTNWHQGGSLQALTVSESEAELALQVAGALRLDIAAIDLVSSSEGPFILEANASPGFEGLEQTIGQNLAGPILDYVEQRAALSRRGTA